MLSNFSKKAFWAAGITVAIFALVFFFAGAAEIKFPANINPSIPGTNEATQANPDPVGIIGNLFQFALLIGGLLAFIMIVYGGIEYAASGDSGSGQKEAKDRIKQALLGLLLLAGSFVLLQTTNPQLTKLSFPTLDKIMGTDIILPGFTGGAMKAGGRCINDRCNAGLFCFRDDKCYTNIACDEGGNDGSAAALNQECSGRLKTQTGRRVSATCSSGFCKELNDCSNNPEVCGSSNTCVNERCKLNGTEGAKCNNGDCLYDYLGCSASVPGTCRIVTPPNDIPCGDQIGACAVGQGNCLMDRENIGKFKCLTTRGPNGICLPGDTIERCNSRSGIVGGYCHAGDCYSNDSETGPFPVSNSQ